VDRLNASFLSVEERNLVISAIEIMLCGKVLKFSVFWAHT
jgi:hypothetical protein